MKYMLDTNICIYIIKNKDRDIINELTKHDPSDICISSITYSELIFGVEKSKYKDRNRIALSMFLSSISIIDFDVRASEEYGTIRAYLETNGEVIGNMDMLIAGHCKSLGYTLVTNNEKEFKRIKDLNVINWVN